MRTLICTSLLDWPRHRPGPFFLTHQPGLLAPGSRSICHFGGEDRDALGPKVIVDKRHFVRCQAAMAWIARHGTVIDHGRVPTIRGVEKSRNALRAELTKVALNHHIYVTQEQ